MSGFLGGITRSFLNPMTIAQLAMGPAGWASLAMRTIGSQIAMNVISQLGQQLGLPQGAISMAQAAFANASGQPGLAMQKMGDVVKDFADQLNLSPQDQGEMTRDLEDAINKLVNDFSQGDEFKKAKSSGGKGWIMALAEAMGKKLDKKSKEVQALSDKINDKSPSTTTKFTAASQEFSVLMNAVNSAIKTLGEGVAGMARKQ